MNVQVVTDPAGKSPRLSPTLPGWTHDLTAARAHKILGIFVCQVVPTLVDMTYVGAGD